MRLIGPLTLVLLGVLTGVLALAARAGSAPKIPADFVFEEGKYSPGPVVFSHQQHYAKVGRCQACHISIFRMKKGTAQITFRKIAAGRFCGACHDGKTEVRGTVVFAAHEKHNCGRCHEE
jgi:c(7)-type cytochrome triheme protein